MPIRASQRVLNLGAYAFAELDELVARLAESGVEPVDFGVGDPTAPTPDFIRQACSRAIEEHSTSGYPSYIGSLPFREAAARWMRGRFGVAVDPADEVTATIGSKEAVFNVHEGFVDPGDVVISPSPGYPPYVRGAAFAEGGTCLYPLEEKNSFLPDLGAIPSEMARKARVFWLCHPNAPTGRVMPPQTLMEIAAFCREYGLLLCSDEAYTDIYFSEPPTSVLQYAREGVLAFYSLSKRSAMTGYRCGWVCGDPEAIGVLRKVKTNIDSGTPHFIQAAAIAALSDEAHVAAMREDYRKKRDILCDVLESAGFPRHAPEAGLYIWQRTPEGRSGIDVARRLMQPDTAVIVTPGAWLADPLPDGSNPGEDFIRLALVPPIERVAEAAERLGAVKDFTRTVP
jgi:LL-diaminopimelate aminotransferase